jgi:hypothetical protein
MKKVVSIIALVIGVVTFSIEFLCIPGTVWYRIFPGFNEFHLIEEFLGLMAMVRILYFYYLWPLIAIGLVLSIVALFIERDKCLRLLPLLFFLFGLIFFSCLLLFAF